MYLKYGYVYFLSNQEMSTRDFVVSFRIDGRRPELWDAATGRIEKSLDWLRRDGRTEVSLKLAPAESAFIVFRETTTETSGSSAPCDTTLLAMNVDEWNITFHTTGREIKTPELFDWASHPDQDVKYYSGTATYTTSFTLPETKATDRILLNLDGLHDVATVIVNGIDCGIVWTAPYSVDITEALHAGENELSIAVTNTWANALLGADSGHAPFDGIWTNGTFRRETQTLIPAGLITQPSFTILSRK